MTTTTTIENAIQESIDFDMVVKIEMDSIDAALAEIKASWDGDYEYAMLDATTIDVWGWTEETADNEQEWRIQIKVG